MHLLGYDVLSTPVSDVVKSALQSRSSLRINTINPHSYVVAKSDHKFFEALKESECLVPDGSGFVLAARLLTASRLEKVAGFDLFLETMRQLDNKSGRVFFLGSSERVLSEIRSRSSTDFPGVVVAGFSPPFVSEFSDKDVGLFLSVIAEFRPDVVFVGLTAPKQEKLISRLRAEGVEVSFLSGIGAVFDFYAGTIKRPGRIWVALHLEWFVRLLGEPRRLWRRNFISTPIFLFDLILAWVRARLF